LPLHPFATAHSSTPLPPPPPHPHRLLPLQSPRHLQLRSHPPHHLLDRRFVAALVVGARLRLEQPDLKLCVLHDYLPDGGPVLGVGVEVLGESREGVGVGGGDARGRGVGGGGEGGGGCGGDARGGAVGLRGEGGRGRGRVLAAADWNAGEDGGGAGEEGGVRVVVGWGGAAAGEGGVSVRFFYRGKGEGCTEGVWMGCLGGRCRD